MLGSEDAEINKTWPLSFWSSLFSDRRLKQKIISVQCGKSHGKSHIRCFEGHESGTPTQLRVKEWLPEAGDA